MDFITVLTAFVGMFNYTVKHNIILESAYGDTSLWKREVRLYDSLVRKNKESLVMVLAHEAGHVWHLEYDLEGTTQQKKICWELCADLFALEILSLAEEKPSDFIYSHMVDAAFSCSMSDRRWASQTAKRGIEEFKKFLEKNR